MVVGLIYLVVICTEYFEVIKDIYKITFNSMFYLSTFSHFSTHDSESLKSHMSKKTAKGK